MHRHRRVAITCFLFLSLSLCIAGSYRPNALVGDNLISFSVSTYVTMLSHWRVMISLLVAVPTLAVQGGSPSLNGTTLLFFSDGNWGSWTPWTFATATCGGGGIRVRSRICQAADPYGIQVCTRPGESTIETQKWGHGHCDGFQSVIPLGCWKVTPDNTPLALPGQNPGMCASRCLSGGFPFSAIDQTVTGPSGKPGTCYCMHNYTIGGRSTQCTSVCQDQTTQSYYYGYLCGFKFGYMHASVYALRLTGQGIPGQWGDWSSCDCDSKSRTRTRECYESTGGLINCIVPLRETESCVPEPFGTWTLWSSWSSCSRSCGGSGLQTRTRKCLPPCEGVYQVCRFSGEIQRDEVQCGFAPCLKDGYERSTAAGPSVGCYNTPPVFKSFGLLGKDNNPGLCFDLCFSGCEHGYVAMDMSNAEGPDWGNCACVSGDDYTSHGPNTLCTETCGGVAQAFPGMLCGSTTPYISTIYRKPGTSSILGQWSSWSSCNCPLGQTRRRACQVSPLTFQECGTANLVENRDCFDTACVTCPHLSAPLNGQIGGDFLNGIRAKKRFQCNAGYRLVGPAVIQCTYVGVWNSVPPFCQADRCPQLKPLKNGNMSTTTDNGDIVLYFCDDGYNLFGPQSLLCDLNGNWNDTEALCLAPPTSQYPNTTAQTSLHISTTLTSLFIGSTPMRTLWWTPTLTSPVSINTGPYSVKQEIEGHTKGGVPIIRSSLIIGNVTLDMEGVFTCEVDNSVGMASRKVNLQATSGQQTSCGKEKGRYIGILIAIGIGTVFVTVG